MRSTITLNGKNSSEIEGLLIQSLPPISKPLMRTTIEEIDGRDGDIVTNLGFSAYTKEFTIGLYGNFDINEVIAYFNSEGVVTFSNEPDKYYNYQIIEQIDFERLIRFRTATISMHCQPFKYSTTEGADILSSNSNFATLDQSINTDSQYFTYSSNTQADVTATRNSVATGSKFFATFTMNVVQGITYYFRGDAASPVTMYGYKDRIWGTSAGFSGRKLTSYSQYTATYTGTLIIGFYGSGSLYIRNFYATNETSSTVSGEGNLLALEGTGEAPFNSYEMKGDTSQQTYSGKNKLYLVGKTSSGVTGTVNDNGTITLTGTATTTDGISLASSAGQNLPAGTYTFTIAEPRTSVTNLIVNTNDGNKNARIAAGGTSATLTTTSAGTGMNLFIAVTNGVTYNETIQLQLVAGSTADYDFEPYVGGTASPNPDYPQDVNVVTGSQVIKIRGKNLFDNTPYSSGSNGITTTRNSDGSYTISGTATNTWATTTNTVVQRLNSGTYTMSVAEAQPFQIVLRFIDTDGNRHDYWMTAGNTSKTVTTDFDIATVNWYISNLTTGMTYNNTFFIQLEKNSTATDFEPSKSQTQTINIGSVELCKIGTYQDKIYKDGADWYIHKETRKVDVSALSGWFYSNSTNFKTKSAEISDLLFPAENTELAVIMSSDYTVGTADRAYGGRDDYSIGLSKDLGIFIRNKDITSLANFSTYLANNQIYAYAALATPTNTKITDTNLIEQLDALYEEAHAYNTRTHMASSATGTNLPHIMAVEVNGSMDGTITNSGNTIARPKLTIFGSGNIGISLNGVQLFQVALGSEGHITIDTAAMEAYQDTPDNLKNRLVTGDYSNFVLQTGDNQIGFSGNATMCVVENYSRWL